MPEFSPKTLDHIKHPRNVGSIPNADSIGESGDPRTGNYLKIWIKLGGRNIKHAGWTPERSQKSEIGDQTVGAGSCLRKRGQTRETEESGKTPAIPGIGANETSVIPAADIRNLSGAVIPTTGNNAAIPAAGQSDAVQSTGSSAVIPGISQDAIISTAEQCDSFIPGSGQNAVIEKITFKAYGCVPALAAGSATTEMAKGKTVSEALQNKADDIEASLGGLPPDRKFCAKMAEDALKNALRKL